MPYNALLGPDQCYGVDDAGYCPQCGEHLDSGRCDCARCDECSEIFEHEAEAIAVTVRHVKTGEPVTVEVCDRCAGKLERAKQ